MTRSRLIFVIMDFVSLPSWISLQRRSASTQNTPRRPGRCITLQQTPNRRIALMCVGQNLTSPRAKTPYRSMCLVNRLISGQSQAQR